MLGFMGGKNLGFVGGVETLGSGGLKEGVGVHLGGRDHTTIMHAHKKVAELLKKDNKFKRRVDIIYNELNLN